MKFCSRQRALRGDRFVLLLLAALLFLTQHSKGAALCPTTIENDPPATADGCGVLLNVGLSLGVQPIVTGTLAYNGGDSTFGVTNNSNSVLSSLFLAGGEAPITNFTGDGISTYVSANGVAIPPTPPIVFGYEDYYGPFTTFSQVDFTNSSLLVDFAGGLLPGTSTYFSLPGDPVSDVSGLTGPSGAIVASATSSVPEPGSLTFVILAALAIGSYALFRKAVLRCNSLLANAVSRHRHRSLAISILILGTLLSASAAHASNIITLPSKPEPEQLADAKQQLLNGAFVAMADASPATFSGDFNVVLPQATASSEIPLRYCVIGAHRHSNGLIHTYTGPQVLPGPRDLSTCMTDFKKWAEKEDLLQGTPPDVTAWTELSMNTVSSIVGNLLQETLGVYRANSNNSRTDYYMITKQVVSTPHFDQCPAYGSCGWYTTSRNLTISQPDGFALVEHGPLSANNVTTASFSVGLSVSGISGGASGSYTVSWSQQDVTTDDNTNAAVSNEGSWHDSFRGRTGPTGWDATPPPAVNGPWQSDQAVIYQVPVGTPSFYVEVQDTANFEYDNGAFPSYQARDLNYFVKVSPPSLSVIPATGLKVIAGQQVTFDISAIIPNSTGENIAWTVSDDTKTGLNYNTTTGSGNQTIQFQVPSGATPGLLGTINIDTTPTYASPEVRTGPLKLPVTVVSNSSVPAGVLLTGGTDWKGNALQTAEVWTPSKLQSTLVGNMTQARAFHTATPIGNQQIFLAGGLDASKNTLGATEIYTEATKSFSGSTPLQVARAYHTATLLNDGTVLLVGGADASGEALASAELYNPVDTSMTLVGSMSVARVKHTATKLPDGTVLIAGGTSSLTDANGFASAEIYDPKAQTFSLTAPMSIGLQSQAATLLTNGQVLLAHGQNSAGSTSSSLLYTPASGLFTAFSSRLSGTVNSALVALPQQGALLVGGTGEQESWGFLWLNNSFAAPSIMQESRDRPQVLSLQNTGSALDGYVLTAGGVVPQTGSSGGTAIEAYNPGNNVWTAVGKMTTPRSGNTATLFGAVEATSSTALTALPNPSVTGQGVTFTAIVNGPGGTPTGSVSFMDATTTLGTAPLSGGNAVLVLSTLPLGDHTITAVYSGDSTFSRSTSPILIQTVDSPSAKPIFSSLAASQTIAFGTANLTLSGVLSAPGPVYPAAKENILITIGDVNATAAVGVNGSFSLTNFPAAALTAGMYSITYSYAGDAKLTGANDSSTTLTVNSLTPVFSNLTGSQVIAPGTASISLAGKIAAGNSFPTGSVTITINSVSSSAAIAANGAFATSVDTHAIPASATPYTITYRYAGATNFGAANDGSTTLTVEATTSAITLRSSPDRSALGQAVNLIATVSSSTGTPTGTVTFMDGTTVLGNASLNAGQAVFVTSTLASGTHQLTAVYGGGPGYGASTSPAAKQIVLFAPAFSELTPSQTIAIGTPGINLSGVVSAPGPTYPAVNEKVYITIGGVNVTAPIGPNGAFSITNVPTVALKTGTYPITYAYAGSSTFGEVTDISKSLTVNNQTTAFSSLTPSQVISFGTASINLSGKIAAGTSFPTGSVSIAINGVSTPAPIGANGVFSTSFDTHAIPSSTTPYPIIYSYPGGANFSAANDATTTLLVNKTAEGPVATTTTMTASVQQCITGSPFQLFITVAPTTSALGVPSGQVSLTRLNPDGSKTPLLQFLDANGQWNPALNGTSDAVAPGTYTYVATYQGSQNYQSSTAQLNLTCSAQ